MSSEHRYGFTIVELLVVIVVIGILSAVTIVSYSGVNKRAEVASMKSDLNGGKKLISLFQISNGLYPSANNCVNTLNSEICLKPSSGNEYVYTSSSPYSSYELMIKRNNIKYYLDDNNELQVYSPVSGGTIIDSGGYRTHTFATAGTLTVNTDITAEVTIIAAGGGGGGGTCGIPKAGDGLNGGNSSITYNGITYIAYGGSGGGGGENYSDGSDGANGLTSNPFGWIVATSSNSGAGGAGGEGMGGAGGAGGKLSKTSFNLVSKQNMTINTVGYGGTGGSGTGSCEGTGGANGKNGGNGSVTIKYAF